MRSLPRGPITQLALLFAAAASVLAVLAVHVRDWVVMTDELQYAKLATAFGRGDVLPTLRGVHVSAYAQLYPALLSPLYGFLAAPTAFRAAHVVNALLFAAAVVPAYLLGREAGLSPRWAVAGAGLCIALPWTLLSGFVMTESAAYLAFMVAMVACQRALLAPAPRRDVLAIAAIALAVLARTQFLVLAGVLPVAAVVVGGRRSLERHRVLAVAFAAAVVLAAVLRDRALGSYSVAATHGSILSWRVFEQAGAHLDVIGVGIGLVPLLLGGAWMVDGTWRREPFAALSLVTLAAVALEASSFDARFGGGLAGIRGRYVFYVAPLLLLAMLLLLARRRLPAVALAGVAAFVAVTVLAHDFPHVAGVYIDAPEAVANDAIRASGGRAFIALLALVLAYVFTRLPFRYLISVALAATVAVSSATAAADWERLLTAHGPSGRLVSRPPDVVYDWIDRVLPSGSDVALLPYPVHPDWAPSAIFWWDVEFWNRDVDRAYVLHGNWDYAPFPHRELHVDARTGVVAGTANAPRYLVTSVSDARVHIAGERIGFNYGMDIRDVGRPWRVDWTTSGLDPDGWTRVGRRAEVHVFAPRDQDVRVEIHLTSPDFRVSVASRNGVCVPSSGSAVTRIPVRPAGEVPPLPLAPGEQKAPREVGWRVTSIDVVPVNPSCS